MKKKEAKRKGGWEMGNKYKKIIYNIHVCVCVCVCGQMINVYVVKDKEK